MQRNIGDEYEIADGRWIEFVDANGFGFAQPDFFVDTGSSVILLESKLTQCDDGYRQMDLLYRPLLRHIYKRPVVGVLVCKNLVKDPGESRIDSPLEILGLKEEATFTWHLVA